MSTKSKSQELRMGAPKGSVNCFSNSKPLSGPQLCTGVMGDLLCIPGRHVGICMGCRCSPFSNCICHRWVLTLLSYSLPLWIDFLTISCFAERMCQG